MSRDYIDIGPVPSDEPCQQVGTENYDPMVAWQECRVFLKQLRRLFGGEPDGAALKVRFNEHEFGSYPTVVCWFDGDNEEAVNYAITCQDETPECWDDEAKAELNRLLA